MATIFIFHFFGSQILGFHHMTILLYHNDIVQTLIFDMFVFAEIFNSVNCRRLDRKLNVLDVEELVFHGHHRHWFVPSPAFAFDVTYMGAREWCISIALGCVSPLLGALIHFIPDEICESAFKELQLLLPEPESLNLSKR
ncbi:hypothetical protein EDB83DRAFT_2527212 [Lactarius deliciosus]|nr:hypothetical protein EDB83DRAFT_2527212 [Lactarius deliciosus]